MLSLVISLLTLTALAQDAPEEAPAAEDEAPAEGSDAPAAEDEAPAEGSDAPAAEDEAEPAEEGPPPLRNCASGGISTDGVYEAMELAEGAFADEEYSLFGNAVEYAEQVLPCLNEPMPRRMAAQWHRLMGLKHVAAQEDEPAKKAFAAARGIEPYYQLPSRMLPEGLDVKTRYDAVDVEAGAYEPVEPGELQLDGRAADERPVDWPTIAQVSEMGAIVDTVYVLPGEPLPAYPRHAAPDPVTPEPVPVPLPTRGKPEPSIPLVAAAGGAAVAGVALFGVASASRAKWADEATPYSELDALESRTNTMTTASIVAGVATLGLGGAVVATW